MNLNKCTVILCAIILSIGFLGAGFGIGRGFYLTRLMNRTVTVKGLAERDVKSDLGLWEVNYRVMGNDLTQLDQNLQRDEQVIITFLKQQGFADNEISRTTLRVEDRLANVYNQNSSQNPNEIRYVITSGIHVRTAKVDLLAQTVQLANKLLQQGVSVNFDSATISPNPSFYFTQLDSVRPEMLADATKSAHTVAEQFAKDADTRLAGIQNASQGVFQIMGRDTSTMSADWSSNQNALGSIDKKVRLVTTINYRLK